jgi:SMI1/KNR4 family protein SUKH-1
MTLTESYQALLGLSSEYDLDLAEFEPNDCSDQIEDLQKELGLLLHPDIKEFLSTGGDQLPYLLPDVIAFCEASSTLESLSNVGGTFGHSWIPISEDQGGECFCLDNDTGQIIRVVYQHTEWHTSVVAESLGAFFEYGVEAIKGAGGEPISGYVPAARNELKRVTPDRTRWRRQEANLPFGCPSCGQTGYFRVLADKAASHVRSFGNAVLTAGMIPASG